MRLLPILLLTISNGFMTYAWYGHLKDAKHAPLWLAVLLSWGIAFFEYCFMVPANRLGHQQGYTFAQLKTIQEIVTLAVFAGFAVFYFKERLAWNHAAGFALIAAAGFFIFGFEAPPGVGADTPLPPVEANVETPASIAPD